MHRSGRSVNKPKLTCRWYVAKANCMVQCIPSRPRRKGNSSSGFTWTMSFPENSRRPFPASPLAPGMGKANAGKVVSVHYWPQEKPGYPWTPAQINVTSMLQTGGVTAWTGLLVRGEYSWRCATRLKSMFLQSQGSDWTKLNVLLLHPMHRMSTKFSMLTESMIKGQRATVQGQVRGEPLTAARYSIWKSPLSVLGIKYILWDMAVTLFVSMHLTTGDANTNECASEIFP